MKIPHLPCVLFALLMAPLVTGCASADASPVEETNSTSEPIRNGDGLPGGYAEVVKITRGRSGCSGSLLTNGLVLTAKHCIHTWDGDFDEGRPIPPERVFPAAEIVVTYGNQVVRGAMVLWNTAAVDVALIQLARPFDVGGSTTTFRRALRSTPVRLADVLECYGYGNNDMDGSGLEVGFGALRHSTNAVLSVNGSTFQIGANSRGQIAMGGDSGGACFLGQEIVGVFSRSNRTTSSTLASSAAFNAWASNELALFPDGNTLRDGELLRDDVGRISVTAGGTPLWISSWDEYVRDWSGRPMHQTGRLNLPAVPADGTLLRDPGGEIDIFWGGARFHVPSMEEFYALGPLTAHLQPAPAGSFFGMTYVPRDGIALRDRVSGEIDVMIGRQRWHVRSWDTYVARYASWQLYQVPAGSMSTIPFGGVID